MTSNIGAELINFSDDQKSEIEVFTKDKIIEQVKTKFKPEFLNRIDDIIIFNRLTKNEIYNIIKIQIDSLSNILKEKKIRLKLDNTAKDWLAMEGFSSEYGARPLKRVIQTHIIDELARSLLLNKSIEDKTVNIFSKNNELKFSYE